MVDVFGSQHALHDCLVGAPVPDADHRRGDAGALRASGVLIAGEQPVLDAQRPGLLLEDLHEGVADDPPLLLWFNGVGEGGEFEYWPQGMDKPSLSVRPPFFNMALMADNEYTYHRVCEVGSKDDFLPDNQVPYSATLDLDEVFDRILANVGWVIPHDTAAIFFVAEDVAQIVRLRGWEEMNSRSY